MAFTDGDRQKLLDIAENALRYHLGSAAQSPDPDTLPPSLHVPGAAFVTLRRSGDLRGCIGTTAAALPLWRVVWDMAIAAASRDPRFPTLGQEELDGLYVEVSILTPPRRIRSAEEIVVGRDGVIIKKPGAYGLLLPQVAPEQGWNREQFLDNVCLKANLPPGAWKDPNVELLAFSAEKFSRTLSSEHS